MKFTQICILALVCVAVIAGDTAKAAEHSDKRPAEHSAAHPAAHPVASARKTEASRSSERSGHASDDWNEKTDVINTHKIIEGSHSISRSNSWKNATGKYVAKAGDIVNEWTEKGHESTYTHTVIEAPVTRIVNGKVVTTYEKIQHKGEKRRRFKTVKRFWSDVKYVESVTIIIVEFCKIITPLCDADYQLFNTMATTDSNKLWSDYNYWEVRDMDLQTAVAKISAVYKTKLCAADIKASAQAILDCKFGYVAGVIDSSSIDINNKNGWTIYAEFFAATCSKVSTKNQLFAWAGSKQGLYLPGAYSNANSVTLSNLLKRWLFTHIGLLISCTHSPVKRMNVWEHQVESSKSK